MNAQTITKRMSDDITKIVDIHPCADAAGTTDYELLKAHGFQQEMNPQESWTSTPTPLCEAIGNALDNFRDPIGQAYMLDRLANASHKMIAGTQKQIDRTADFVRYWIPRANDEISCSKLEMHSANLATQSERMEDAQALHAALTAAYEETTGDKFKPYVFTDQSRNTETAASVEAQAALAKASKFLTKKPPQPEK